MTYTPAEIAGAQELIDEYNAAYERREEPHYPHEAAAILKACAEAEQLTEKVLELGGKNNG
jgi:hypothetical protein